MSRRSIYGLSSVQRPHRHHLIALLKQWNCTNCAARAVHFDTSNSEKSMVRSSITSEPSVWLAIYQTCELSEKHCTWPRCRQWALVNGTELSEELSACTVVKSAQRSMDTRIVWSALQINTEKGTNGAILVTKNEVNHHQKLENPMVCGRMYLELTCRMCWFNRLHPSYSQTIPMSQTKSRRSRASNQGRKTAYWCINTTPADTQTLYTWDKDW